MNFGNQDRGIVLLGSPDGTTFHILRDDLGLALHTKEGVPFDDLVDPENADKARAFVAGLMERGALYDWEINVPVGGIILSLHFGGARVEDGYVVVGARTRIDLERVNEEILLINSEQTNALRAASKQIALLTSSLENPRRDDVIYDELSQVNNELANLQREMVRKNTELSKLNDEKNHFLGMAAHDLRSPLGIVLTYADFLESEAQLSGEHREFLATIKQTSRFMLGLVENLLDVSAIEAGRLDLRLEPADLTAVVAHNAALHRALAAPKRIEIVFIPPREPLGLVLLDAGKFEQVLNNLLSNAVKYSPPGSIVEIALAQSEGGITVSVRDQGPGIPPAELSKLFKPFGTTSVRTTGGEKSTGLGLAIVRRIVEGHGGTVEVASEVGKGSVFRVSLPLPKAGVR